MRYTAITSIALTAAGLTASTGIAGSAYQSAVLASLPNSYWRFEESSGQASNSIANAPAGTVTGSLTRGVASATTALGSCYRFQGGGVQVPYSIATRTSASFTVELWAKVDVLTAPSHLISVGRDINLGSLKVVFYGGYAGIPYRLNGDLGNNGADAGWTPNPTEFSRWHHYVYSRDAQQSTAAMYVDGVLVDQRTFSSNLLLLQDPFLIGMHGSTAYPYFFYGSIDEVAIYQRVLAPAEIAAHFCASGLGVDCCGAGESCCPGDINSSGTVDGADVGALLAFWGEVTSTTLPGTDINRDGVVNGADLGMLLSNWGPCP